MGLVVLVALLGPLLLARVRQFRPAPGGIVVRPDAPKLNMAVVVDSSPDNPVVKPLVASLTGARPQPAHIVIEPGATAPAGVDMVVEIEPDVVFATPEALDRIAHALDTHPSIAVQPWQKTSQRRDMWGLFPLLVKTLATGAFSLVPLGSRWKPSGLRAYKANAADATPTVYGGGHVVARVGAQTSNGRYNLIAALFALLYVAGCIGAVVGLITNPSWGSLGVYALYVLSLSICLRQIAKFPRASALIYPVTLLGAPLASR